MQWCPKTSATSVSISSTTQWQEKGVQGLPNTICQSRDGAAFGKLLGASSAQGDGPRWLEHTGLRQEGVGADLQAMEGN